MATTKPTRKPQSTRTCSRCSGSGVYRWGACVNGRMTHSGVCYHCVGKGYQDADDVKRCNAYWRYAIRSAI